MTEQMEPKLRFKDKNNNDYPDWETKKLHQIVDVKDGTHESPKPTDDGYLLVTSKNLKNSTLDFSESYSISKEDYEDINKRSKVEIGDILFGMIGTIGNPILLEKDGFAIKNVALLKTSSLQEREYILNFLKSNSITKQFYKLNVGGTQKFISLRSIRDLKIDIPSSEEAIKIGGFFNKLDRQIELEEEKLELLEQQKRGYMQKIFSQELRFKDENGNEYPKWVTQKIKELGNVYTGNTPSKKQSTYWNSNNYIWVTPTDINNKKDLKNSEYMLSDEGFKKARQLPKNTLLITCIASIGKNAILREEGSCNQQINALVPNSDKNVDFLYYAFEKVSKYMKRIAGKTATQIVNKSTFENISIEVPNFEEQLKAGRFLNSFDKLIEKQVSKIELLKQRKQGFLQKMFV
ncbi:restriction endonuclease subunit S [Staphylococcus epidermidis]|nr:restriction endonuclease subunit S [Staphylococcus epidermidis]